MKMQSRKWISTGQAQEACATRPCLHDVVEMVRKASCPEFQAVFLVTVVLPVQVLFPPFPSVPGIPDWSRPVRSVEP